MFLGITFLNSFLIYISKRQVIRLSEKKAFEDIKKDLNEGIKAGYNISYNFPNPIVQNQYVASRINEILTFVMLSTNNFAIEIHKDDKTILIRPLPKINKSKMFKTDEFTLLKQSMKPELFTEKNKIPQLAFTFSELIIDLWLKFGADYFYIEIEVEKEYDVALWYNKATDKRIFDAYWNKDTTNGYNIYGKFWDREWFDNRHKQNVSGGAKR